MRLIYITPDGRKVLTKKAIKDLINRDEEFYVKVDDSQKGSISLKRASSLTLSKKTDVYAKFLRSIIDELYS